MVLRIVLFENDFTVGTVTKTNRTMLRYVLRLFYNRNAGRIPGAQFCLLDYASSPVVRQFTFASDYPVAAGVLSKAPATAETSIIHLLTHSPLDSATASALRLSEKPHNGLGG
jgi:hypothetical protein